MPARTAVRRYVCTEKNAVTGVRAGTGPAPTEKEGATLVVIPTEGNDDSHGGNDSFPRRERFIPTEGKSEDRPFRCPNPPTFYHQTTCSLTAKWRFAYCKVTNWCATTPQLQCNYGVVSSQLRRSQLAIAAQLECNCGTLGVHRRHSYYSKDGQSVFSTSNKFP